MSHFSVLVVGENVEAQLAPYHEFECTGRDDEYVQNVDKTAEARAEYDGRKVKRLRNPEGKLFDPYEDRFYLDPTPEELKIIGPIAGSGCGSGLSWTSKDWNDGRGYRAKVRKVPSSWEEIEVPIEKVQSFAEWAADWYGLHFVREGHEPDLADLHKYGYIVVRKAEVVAVVDRTNPNKKWDWWELGGRWTGFFKMKPNRPPIMVGRPGLMTERAKRGHGDVAKKRDIDFDGMRDEAGDKAAERWDVVNAVLREHPPLETWESARARFENIDDARDFYHKQPAMVALRANKQASEHTLWDGPDKYLVSRVEYVQRARDSAISTFAVVRDGKWYERGKMGWWGVVSDEKDDAEWSRQFAALLDELPDDTLLSVVDCHI